MTFSQNTSNEFSNPAPSQGRPSVVVVCEHASCFIPQEFNDLGLTQDALQSHAAWDPGALGLAQGMAQRLAAPLVCAEVSRLVYDCNRPPSAPDAMPAKSEIFEVPGNVDLTTAQRSERVSKYYEPFRAKLAEVVASTPHPVLFTVHSFTPVYNGQNRAVEIGILHDTDQRLADAMLNIASAHTQCNVQRNAPYGPQHGVTHTLKEHALGAGHLNVMLEVRNDLIQTSEQQDQMAQTMADWLSAALSDLDLQEPVSCQA